MKLSFHSAFDNYKCTQTMNPTATHINYFFTCKRKLWLFSRKISCEQESDLVKIGKIYHEDFEKDNIEIENMKIDKIRNGKVFEFKKKNTAPEAARYQVLYYLWRLKQKGINTTGIIKYKENNRIEEVELNGENEEILKKSIQEIKVICFSNKPQPIKRIKYCKNCSYYELCFS